MDGRPSSESIPFLNGWPSGNYASKLFNLLLEGKIPHGPGSISHVVVRHDDSCPALRGSSCTCDPDVVYVGTEFVNRDRSGK